MRPTPTLVSTAARRIVGGSLLVCLLAVAPAAHAQLTFQFNFAPGFSAPQQQAVVTAGALFSQMFATHFSNTATVQFDVFSVNDGLASAGSYGFDSPGFGNGEIVRNKIVNGIDLNPGMSAGLININLATNFQYDPNAPVDFANGQIDFYSVLDHELTHALGFSAGADNPSTTNTSFNKFDQYLTTLAGVPLVDPSTGTINVAARSDALANGALFKGTGSPISIEGMDGELSHLGTVAFSFPTVSQNALMLCCGGLVNSFEPRDYNAAEVSILADLGYTLAPVPEPSTYALMMAGVAYLGFAAKRRIS